MNDSQVIKQTFRLIGALWNLVFPVLALIFPVMYLFQLYKGKGDLMYLALGLLFSIRTHQLFETKK